MKNETYKLPFYVQFSLISVSLIALTVVLYWGQQIILPLIFSAIIAIVLCPVVDFMVSKKINRILAICLSILMVSLITVFALLFLLSQLSMFSESLPALNEKFDLLMIDLVSWVCNTFKLNSFNVKAWIKTTNVEILNESRGIIGQTLLNIGSVLVVIFLIPVYVFMILYYKTLLVKVIHQLFKADAHKDLDEILKATKSIVQRYLVGLVLEAVIVAILGSVFLLILDIDYAILLGVIGAVLNLIPYVGGMVGGLLPMLIALATKSPIHAFWVMIAYILIQFIDNNFIVPKIVASKVEINGLVSIIVVIMGGALWGLSGMILSIPLIAVLKVIFDHSKGLKPWGLLLGNKM